MESEDIKEIFRSLNESNQSILTLVAKGMSLAQNYFNKIY